jgi:hypothetical protein
MNVGSTADIVAAAKLHARLLSTIEDRIRSQSETGSNGPPHGTPLGHRNSEKEVRIIGRDDEEREEGARVASRFCVETTFVYHTGSKGEIHPTAKVGPI